MYGDFFLTFAQGQEQWIPIGNVKSKPCVKGELIWRDDYDVSTRSLNWRQCDRTKLTRESRNGYFIMDGFENINRDLIEKASNEFVELITSGFGGKANIYWLDKKHPEAEVDFETKTLKDVVLFEKKQPVKTVKPTTTYVGLDKVIADSIRKVSQIEEINVEIPEIESHGDYSSNVAMQVASSHKKDPQEVAQELVIKLNEEVQLKEFIEKIDIAHPGFINFWVKDIYLLDNLNKIIKKKDKYGSSNLLEGKTISLEHTSPNPQTTIMLGHLRNNFLGMSVSKLLGFQGAKVIKDAIVNDRGIHISRSLFGYLVFANKKTGLSIDELINYKEIPEEKILSMAERSDWRDLLYQWVDNKLSWLVPQDLSLKPDHANLIWYVLGSKSFKKSEVVESQVKEILLAWEAEDEKVWDIWRTVLNWSDTGYIETYKRIGSEHDWVWYESELYKGGKEMVLRGLEKGIFQKSKGAIVTNLKKYGLPDNVVIKSDGTSTYIVFDLNLTANKIDKYKADKYIWTIGAEQSLYFKQMFAVCEQLGLGKLEDFYHLSYALINFKGGGKMATREGSVVPADDVLNQLEEKARGIIENTNSDLRGKLSEEEKQELVKKVALGAIKYSLLKYARETTVFYDLDESISLEGNSGPYIQYTYTRTLSVLLKAGKDTSEYRKDDVKANNLNEEELSIMRLLQHFPEVVAKAQESYSPNFIANYVFDLAHKYNAFYNKHKIIGSQEEDFRLLLTAATGQVIKTGLNLLGILAPSKM